MYTNLTCFDSCFNSPKHDLTVKSGLAMQSGLNPWPTCMLLPSSQIQTAANSVKVILSMNYIPYPYLAHISHSVYC
jgi:hypothetical protein